MMLPLLTVLFIATLSPSVSAAPACITGRSTDQFAFNAGGESIKQIKFGAENSDYFVGSPGYTHSTTEGIHTPPGCKFAPVYRSERYTRADKLVYSIPVPDGVYTVVTFHAEIYHKAAGKRKFHIDINGARKRTDLDVYAEAQGERKGIALANYNIESINGSIVISFLKSVENPQVSAILVEGTGAEKIATGCCDNCPRSLTPKGKTSAHAIPHVADITAAPKPLAMDEAAMKKTEPSPAMTPNVKAKVPEVPDMTAKPIPLTKSTPQSSIVSPAMEAKVPEVTDVTGEPMPLTESVPKTAAASVAPNSIPAISTSTTPKPSAKPSSKPTMAAETPISSKSGMASAEVAPSSGGCSDGKFIFCEDFNDLSLGKTERTGKWILDGKASIAMSPVRKSKALYLDPSGKGGEKGRLIVKRGISAPGNSMYGRMNVWVKEFATAPPYAHFVIAEMYEGDNNGEAKPGTEKVRAVGGQFVPGQGSLWGIGADGGPTGDWTQHRETAPTVDGKWICVEWSMMAKNSEIKFWIDGKLKPEMTVNADQHDGGHGKFVFPKMDSAWFGWWLFQGDAKPAKFDVYLDDIALAETRIGC